MADDVSLELWMDRRRLTALERVLKERGTDTQTVMQARLDELYRQYVPAQERTEINERMESERLAAERRAEEGAGSSMPFARTRRSSKGLDASGEEASKVDGSAETRVIAARSSDVVRAKARHGSCSRDARGRRPRRCSAHHG